MKDFGKLEFECKNQFVKNFDFYINFIKGIGIEISLDDELILIEIIKYSIFENHI